MENSQACIPKLKFNLTLQLKYLELNGLIFRCAEHSQMYQIPAGVSIINMYAVNWLQSCCGYRLQHPCHMSEMEPGVVRFIAAKGITEGTWLPPALSSNQSIQKDKKEFIAFPVHAVVFMFT